MLRASFCSLAVLALFVIGLARADDAKTKSDKHKKHTQATITKVDAEKNTVTVMMKGRKGRKSKRPSRSRKGPSTSTARGRSPSSTPSNRVTTSSSPGRQARSPK